MKTIKKHFTALLFLATIHISVFAQEQQQESDTSYWAYILPFAVVAAVIAVAWLSSRENPKHKRNVR